MIASFELVAGRLCLDFVNTVSERPCGPATREDLPDYSALLQWSLETGALTTAGAQALARAAATQPRRAQRALAEAIALRERLHRLFRAIIDRRPPDPEDLERFSAAVADVLARRRVSWHRQRYAWAWPGARNELTSVLWPVLLSAQELLCADDHGRLGACSPPEGCGWLYYDTSKNRSRRWCSMKTCGNTVKARRHYARQRGRRTR